MVGQELSRLLPDSAADVATWLDARKPVRGGDLTTEEVTVVGSDGEEAWAKTLLSCHPAGRVVAPDLYIRLACDGV